MLNKILKILLLISFVTSTIALYVIAIYVISHRNITQPVIIYSQKDETDLTRKLVNEFDKINVEVLSNKEYRILISKELNCTFYFYVEKDLVGCNGRLNPYTRTIMIRPTIEGLDYGKTFSHELTHLKYYIKNEKYTIYKSFETLYESDNEHLHAVGVYIALNQMLHNWSDEYNIRPLLINYFKTEKGV